MGKQVKRGGARGRGEEGKTSEGAKSMNSTDVEQRTWITKDQLAMEID
jgi:hypothetical protein